MADTVKLDQLANDINSANKLLGKGNFAEAENIADVLLSKLSQLKSVIKISGKNNENDENKISIMTKEALATNSSLLFYPTTASTASQVKLVISTFLLKIACSSESISTKTSANLSALIGCATHWLRVLDSLKSDATSFAQYMTTSVLRGASKAEKSTDKNDSATTVVLLGVRGKALLSLFRNSQLEFLLDNASKIANSVLSKLKDTDVTPVVDFLETIGARSDAIYKLVKDQDATNQSYVSCLATLAKAYEKSGIFEQARKTLELAWSIPRRLEKTIGDNTEHAEYAIVKMTLGWLYLVNFTVIIQECAAAVVGGSDTTDLMKSADMMLYVASSAMKAGLPHVLVFDPKSKKTLVGYDTVGRIGQVVREIRQLYFQSITTIAAISGIRVPMTTSLFKRLEQAVVFAAQALRLGVDADLKIGNPDGKALFYRQYEWEAYGVAALLAIERDSAKIDEPMAYIEQAIDIISRDKQYAGLQFISSVVCYNLGLWFNQRGTAANNDPSLHKRAAAFLRVSCDTWEEYGKLLGTDAKGFDDAKLAQRIKFLSLCRSLANDTEGALKGAEEGIKKSKKFDIQTMLPLIKTFVTVKLSIKNPTPDVVKRTIYDVLIRRVEAGVISKQQLGEMLQHECTHYHRYRRNSMHLSLLSQILALYGDDDEFSIQRARCLLDRAYLHRQEGDLVSALQDAEEAVDILKLRGSSKNMTAEDTQDDLASGCALVGILQKEGDSIGTYKMDFAKQVKLKVVVEGDPTQNDTDDSTSTDARQVTETVAAASQVDSIQAIAFALGLWTQMVSKMMKPTDVAEEDQPKTLASNRTRFRYPDRTLALLQTIGDLLGILGHPRHHIHTLKLIIKLHRCVIASQTSNIDCMSCYTSIGDIYNNLGYTEPIASRYFNKAKRLVSEEYSRLQQLQKIDWLLASTRYLQNAGLLDAELSSKLAKVEEDMNNLMYSDPSKKNASNWMALAQSKSTLAEVKLKEGNIGEAVALARSAYSLRLSTLPRTDSKSATGMMSTTKWKVIKAYADSLEQTGTLYQIQGSGREAELYFLRGLDLAKSLGITKMKTRFLLKLAQLKLKRKQMEDSAQYFESLVEVKKSHEKLMSESGSKSNPTTMSPDKHVDVALLKTRLGDMRREHTGEFDEAATFYLQAEEYLLQLTDNSYVDALEQVAIRGKETPRGSKIFSKLRVNDQPVRLSLDGASGGKSSLVSTNQDCLPLKRIHIRVRVKRAIAYLLEGIEAKSVVKLLDAKALLLECLSSISTASSVANTEPQPVKKRGKAAAAPQTTTGPTIQSTAFELDRAVVLLQLARVLVAKHELDAKEPEYEGAWSAVLSAYNEAPVPAPKGRGKKAAASKANTSPTPSPLSSFVKSGLIDKDLIEAEQHLTAALASAAKSGALPRLTSDICHALALLIGNTDKKRVLTLMAMAQGVSMRHQMMTAAFEKLSTIKLRALKFSQDEVDSQFIGELSDNLDISTDDASSALLGAAAVATIAEAGEDPMDEDTEELDGDDEETSDGLADELGKLDLDDQSEGSDSSNDINASSSVSIDDASITDAISSMDIDHQSTSLSSDQDSDDTMNALARISAFAELTTVPTDGSDADPEKFFERYVDLLAQLGESFSTTSLCGQSVAHWTITNMSLTSDSHHLIISRVRPGTTPIVAKIPLLRPVSSGSSTPVTTSAEELIHVPTPSPAVTSRASAAKKTAAKKAGAKKASAKRIIVDEDSDDDVESSNVNMKEKEVSTADPSAPVPQIAPLRNTCETRNILTDLRNRLTSCVTRNVVGISKKDDSRQDWWTKRFEYDEALKNIVEDLETQVLGTWKVLMLGEYVSEDLCRKFSLATSDLQTQIEILAEMPVGSIDTELFCAILSAAEFLSDDELRAAMTVLLGCSHRMSLPQSKAVQDGIKLVRKAYSEVVDPFLESDASPEETIKYVGVVKRGKNLVEREITQPARYPVLLSLDKHLHMFPLESMPALINHPVSRVPNLAYVRAQLMQSFDSSAPNNIVRDGINPTSVFYVVNPSTDLKSTEELLRPQFEGYAWDGITSQRPQAEEISEGIAFHDVYIYSGHGGGEQFIPRSAISTNMNNRGGTVALLMGCSSVATTEEHHDAYFDANGPAMSYLLGGSPALVGHLWVVTAGDVDRVTKRLAEWLAPSGASEEDERRSLLELIPEARRLCKLRYMNGAALVHYGLPVWKKPPATPLSKPVKQTGAKTTAKRASKK